MKKYLFLLLLVPCVANGAEPLTSCPSGYVAVDETYMDIATTSCPSGTKAAGTADSCLYGSLTNGSCIMYAPVDQSYTDDTGTYQYTEPCPLS